MYLLTINRCQRYGRMCVCMWTETNNQNKPDHVPITGQQTMKRSQGWLQVCVMCVTCVLRVCWQCANHRPADDEKVTRMTPGMCYVCYVSVTCVCVWTMCQSLARRRRKGHKNDSRYVFCFPAVVYRICWFLVHLHYCDLTLSVVCCWLFLFSTSLKPLNRIRQSLAGSKNSMSSTKLCFWALRKRKMATSASRSSGGVVVKLLACGARGLGFDSRSRRYDFRDWLSPAFKSRYGWNIA